jgi:hypothetical protein
LTIGEKIAKAAEDSKIVENIQARSAAEKARKEKLDVAALTGAEQRVEAQLQSQAEMRRLLAKQKFDEEQKELDRQTQLEEAEITAGGKAGGTLNSYKINVAGTPHKVGATITLTNPEAEMFKELYGDDSIEKQSSQRDRPTVLMKVDPNSPLAQQYDTPYIQMLQDGRDFYVMSDTGSFDVLVTPEGAGQIQTASVEEKRKYDTKMRQNSEGEAIIDLAAGYRNPEYTPAPTEDSDYLMGSQLTDAADEVLGKLNEGRRFFAKKGKDFFVTEETKSSVDAYNAILNGTGVFNQILGRLYTGAGAFGLKGLGSQAAAEARNQLQLIQTMGATSLVDSNRYPVTEVALKRELFISPDEFINNPEESLRKMSRLKELLVNELQALGKDLRQGQTDARANEIRDKVALVRSTLNLMHTIPLPGQTPPLERIALDSFGQEAIDAAMGASSNVSNNPPNDVEKNAEEFLEQLGK